VTYETETETTIGNNNDRVAIGQKAWADLREAGSKMLSFKHRATYVLVNAYVDTIYSVNVETADGVEVLSFGLSEFNDLYEAQTNKGKGAMLDAILEKSFGVTGEDDKARRNELVKVIRTSILMAEKLDDVSEVSMIRSKVGGKMLDVLQVPYTLLHEPPEEGAKQSEINKYNAMRDSLAALDAYSGDNSMSALERAVRPKQDRGTKAPQVATFTPPVKVTPEARLDALVFALGLPDMCKRILARVSEVGGMDELARWAYSAD
jgi:hypothetical protein